MKHLLLTTIAAVVLVGCGESQQSAPAPEAKPVEPVAKAAKPEPTGVKAPDISIHEAAKEGNIEAVKQHLAAGADVNAKDEDGLNPLHYAAWTDHKETVELLLANGADVNARKKNGMTPLHRAASKGSKEVAELLISNGADVNARDKDGTTPLDLAEQVRRDRSKTKAAKKEIADLLRKHGGKTGEELKAEGK